uniref:ribonuclease H n=1 Tax=Denticeps clupeoides TaxID=299321 RepID=A0AAY4BIC4_9TELE
MGLDLFSSLGFSLMDVDGATILTVGSPWQQRWPSLFTGLGCLTAFNHQPLLKPDLRPVIQPLCRLPLALRDEVTAELNNLLELGIIERIDASPWVSNLVLARKKSGTLRPCVDLRSVNTAVVPDKYPLPTVEELAAKFHGSTVFSKLDLRQGYLQVPLHPESRNLTAFVTHMGVFRYTRMPFGLSSAPSCFQKIMSTIFAAVSGVVIYLDDIVVHGPTLASHDEHLDRVFKILAGHNLTLNGDKCVFTVPAVDFVGFRLSGEGITPLNSNVEAVLRLPEPSSPAQLASFLGMTAYYLRFLPQYSATTAPLRALLKTGAPWAWSSACSSAIRQLKAQLTSPPVLAHFDLSCPTFLTCDASGVALGAVLSQCQHGSERPIAFASRSLTPAEQKYSVGEREALACVWACERWHIYLYGRHFTLRTDHQALTTLLSSSGTGHRPLRLHRWSERLLQYNFTPLFTPGRDNVVADLLSRATPDTPPGPATDTLEPELIHMLQWPLREVVSLQDLQLASAQDSVLSQLCTCIREGWPRTVPKDLVPFHRVKDELSCWNEVCVARGLRAVIPGSLQPRILAMAHEGHLGIVK